LGRKGKKGERAIKLQLFSVGGEKKKGGKEGPPLNCVLVMLERPATLRTIYYWKKKRGEEGR